MDEPTTQESRVRVWLGKVWVQGVILGVLALVFMLFYQFLPVVVDTPDGKAVHAANVGLPGADGYYHVKIAYLYRTGEVQAAGADFHWTRESLWNGAFADKDFLFHMYLLPFTLLADGPADADGLVIVGKLGNAVLGMLLVLTMFALLRGFGVRRAWLFAISLTVIGGMYFIFRMNLCRSYLISIILALTGWLLLAREKRLALFLIAVMYTLAYTASHLLLVLAIIRALSELMLGAREGSTRMRDLRRNLVLMGCIAGGIVVGVMLHPHAADLMRMWWVQNVVVLALSHGEALAPMLEGLSSALGVSVNLKPDVELSLGMELDPTKGSNVLLNTPLLLLSPILLPLIAAVLGWRPSRETILSSGPALAFFVLYMINTRFIEYAGPFMTLAAALWIGGILGCDGYNAWKERRPVWSRAMPISAALIALILSAGMWIVASYSYRVADRGEVEPAARWLHENPQAHGQLVWHDRWDDFTKLFFFASECDYLVGLDPTFFYVNDAQRYRQWVEITRGEVPEFLDIIRDDFKAGYILARKGSSEYVYSRLNDYARQGRLELCVKDEEDRWSLYRIVR